MKKYICILFFVCIVISNVVCIPGPQLALYIDNFTKQTVFIDYKLANGDSEDEKNYIWMQEISEQLITILDALYNRSITKISPSKRRSIIEYYATGKLSDLDDKFEDIRAIPLMILLKSTYKELKIYTENGSRLITLDTLENENIVKYDYGKGVTYILEIYEQDVSVK